MKLSVVTVVFNDVNHIEKTINSVLSQNYKDIEYVVIDGNSTDGTKEIIEKYKDKIDVFVSEPDKGLYDAMNKGLRLATGDYVCFMNSGDLFDEENTVEKIFASANGDDVDIFYGDAVVVDENYRPKGLRRHRPPKKLSWKSFKDGMLVSHQAFIPKLSLAEPYDLTYRYSADFDWCIKLMKKAKIIRNTQIVIVQSLDDGLTKKRMFASLKERFKIMRKNYGLASALWVNFRNSFRLMFFRLKHKWF